MCGRRFSPLQITTVGLFTGIIPISTGGSQTSQTSEIVKIRGEVFTLAYPELREAFVLFTAKL